MIVETCNNSADTPIGIFLDYVLPESDYLPAVGIENHIVCNIFRTFVRQIVPVITIAEHGYFLVGKSDVGLAAIEYRQVRYK